MVANVASKISRQASLQAVDVWWNNDGEGVATFGGAEINLRVEPPSEKRKFVSQTSFVVLELKNYLAQTRWRNRSRPALSNMTRRLEVSMCGLTYKTHAGSLEPFTSWVKQKAFIWHCNPIGRDSGFKIRIVWIRLPPVLPTSLTGRNAAKSASLVVGVFG